MKLPPAPYDTCDKVNTRVSSVSLVRYKNNDYSAPTRYGHQEVLAKGYVDRAEIVRRDETIAVHPRSYETADFIYNPLHYFSFDAVMLLLARLENRPARLDLTFYPYLPAATVGATDSRAYLGLIANSASTALTAGA
jgi:hypothetical protein